MSKRAKKTRLPKLCGGDNELGNFILGGQGSGMTGYDASRAVLREIDGVPSGYSFGCGTWSGGTYGSGWGQEGTRQDWGRKYISSNGGCVYIDLDHLELALPEVQSAFDHVAVWNAMLRIARDAWRKANQRLPEGQRIQLLVNNSDGRSNSYGSHLNFLITRRAWDNIFNRRLQYLLFLAAYQASSIVFTGQGKVGSENGAPPVSFQLSQRADFFETLSGLQTTSNRPLVNSRDESLCGNFGSDCDAEMARLHCIFFDAGLCHVSSLLKVGVMQIVLAMIEADQMDTGLLLDDPIDAVRRWSHDISLRARVPILSGAKITAVELQLLILEQAKRFCDAGGCDGIVPRVGEILRLWEDTLVKLKVGPKDEESLEALARRLDWALKLKVLKRAMVLHPELEWDSPGIRHLDQMYGNVDPEEGLYWQFEADGEVERVVSEEDIEYFVHNAPRDTRAWTRALLLEMAEPDEISSIDWDSITFRLGSSGYLRRYPKLEMPNPLGFTKADVERVSPSGSALPEILEALGVREQREVNVPAPVVYPLPGYTS